MRIIKEGKLPPKEKRMKCASCGCVFINAMDNYVSVKVEFEI